MALVMGLFLGGCSTTEPATPSDALVDLIGGKQGHFTTQSGDVVIYYCFRITEDGTVYTDTYDMSTYKYTGGSDNSATYEASNLKIVLSNISSTEGGNITVYGTSIDTTFAWGKYEIPSSISAESHSSIMHAISLQK